MSRMNNNRAAGNNRRGSSTANRGRNGERREALPGKQRPALPAHKHEALPSGNKRREALPAANNRREALPSKAYREALPQAEERPALPQGAPRSKRDLAGDQEIIFGIHAVEELLETKPKQIRALHVLAGTTHAAIARMLSRARVIGVPVRQDTKEAFKALAPQGNHQGVFAIVDSIEYLTLNELLEQYPAPSNPLFVILDGIEDGHNLGAIIRSAHAFGATAVITAERRSAAVSGFVAKAAAGALEHCPVARVTNIAQALDVLIEEGFTTVGTIVSGGRQPWDIPWNIGPIALIIGGEHAGIRPIIEKRCHQLMTIPMVETQESLNASVAAGVALYEAAKGRMK